MSTLSETPSAPQAEGSHGFWRSVGQALRGTEHDYTSGPVGRAILLLSIPMVLEMAMESVFAVVDIFFVSRLGADAVAAVGLTESLLTIVYALAMGLGIGATALVARRIGEKDGEGAAHAAVQAILLALAVSAVLGVAGSLLAPRLLALMGASPQVIGLGLGYARIMLGGEAAIIVLFVVNAIFRGAGDAAIAMRVLWLANLINMVLGPCLIFGLGPFPRLGVTGAAIATTTGRSVGALFALWRLTRSDGRIPVTRRHLALDVKVMGQIVRLAGSATVQMLIGTASWTALARILAVFGSPVLAGYTVAMRVIVFAILPSAGMSNAAATMVGQALGASKPERAEQAVWKACIYNLVFLGVVGVLFVLLARPIVGLFSQDPEVLRYGATALRVVALGFPLYAFGMVLTQAFNGAGDTWTPTWINLAVFWAFEIPLAYVLSNTLGMGPVGAFWAITIAFSSLAVVSWLIFRRGRWKTKLV
ncbi:MATE family efflux transporter [Longimicrobium sp.]|uniref:MATE family efflux transporter n=1 Tax=Longimicrobium sp. TaxID=2029185 RepID=UPI002E2FFDA1|nr:MATE family efflux transporter [Longimicrobium sp.]HEX6040076.1 MATE family efflux transporter [Longimicrobium sp.]